MQVFLLLLDAAGKVVTRNQLFDECWGGAMVGDDSLNRAIAKVRRIASETAPGSFEVETIPRTGYRLVGEIVPLLDGAPRSRIDRRTVLAGAAALVAAGGLGFWWVDRRQDQRFVELMEQGDRMLSYRDQAADAAPYFQRAAEIRPDDAGAWGRFAYARALRPEVGESTGSAATRESAKAVRAALAIDPREPHARLADFLLHRPALDFAETEDRLRSILSAAPDNIHVMKHLWEFLTCVGLCRQALAFTERAVAVDPLSAGSQFPRAQLLWITGRTGEADRVSDQAMSFWPKHRFVRFARFTILAFTGRVRAALAMLEDKSKTPQGFSPESVALWKVNLTALDNPTPANIAAARSASLEMSKKRLDLAGQATMVMSALGEIDSSFEILGSHYALARQAGDRPSKPSRDSTAWRFAPWLFTPPMAAVRADLRFSALCDEIGLSDYWAKRGIKPDYQLDVA